MQNIPWSNSHTSTTPATAILDVKIQDVPLQANTDSSSSFKTALPFSTDFHTRPCSAALCSARQRAPAATAAEAGSPVRRLSTAQRRPGSFCCAHQREGRRELRLRARPLPVPLGSRPTAAPGSASSGGGFYDVGMRQQVTNLAQTKQPLDEDGCH